MNRRGGDVRMTVSSDALPWSEYDLGESIALNGVCLTAVALHDNGFDTDVSVETLDVTALGNLVTGSDVNLEPAISWGERLGGDLGGGSMDGVGNGPPKSADARSIRLAIEVPAEFSRYLARKGSVCVDGVGLTINEVSGNTFESNIIPHTADVTIMGGYTVGTAVNVEVDLLARYIERLISKDRDGISIEFLKDHGYA